jgi:hypothetical protein
MRLSLLKVAHAGVVAPVGEIRIRGLRTCVGWAKHSNGLSRAALECHKTQVESGCAVPWAAASEPLNDEQQNQLKGNRPADINTNIDG